MDFMTPLRFFLISLFPYSIPHISFNIPIADGDLNTLFLNATMPFSDNPSSKELTRKSASRSILWSAATTLSYVW